MRATSPACEGDGSIFTRRARREQPYFSAARPRLEMAAREQDPPGHNPEWPRLRVAAARTTAGDGRTAQRTGLSPAPGDQEAERRPRILEQGNRNDHAGGCAGDQGKHAMMSVARVVVVIIIPHGDVVMRTTMVAPIGAIAATVTCRRPVASIMLAPAIGTVPMRIPPMNRRVAMRRVSARLVAALVSRSRTVPGMAALDAVLATILLAMAIVVRVGDRTQQHSAHTYNRHPQRLRPQRLRRTHGLLLYPCSIPDRGRTLGPSH